MTIAGRQDNSLPSTLGFSVHHVSSREVIISSLQAHYSCPQCTLGEREQDSQERADEVCEEEGKLSLTRTVGIPQVDKEENDKNLILISVMPNALQSLLFFNVYLI